MQKNPFKHRNGIILTAAFAAISAVAMPKSASAQYAAQNGDGHALDANNRVGSGGINSGGARGGGGYTANDVANRNVTGGREFLGPVRERDPGAFIGPIPFTPSDLLNRQSNTPASVIGQPSGIGQATSYYGDIRFAPPPSGSVPLGFNGGYIGTTLNTPSSLSNNLNTASDAQSLSARTMDRETFIINRQLNSPNYVDVMANADLNQTGTLTSTVTPGLQLFSIGHANPNAPVLPELPDRPSADDLSVLRMRNELLDSSQNNQTPGLQNPNGAKTNAQDQNAPPTGLNQPLNQPLGQQFDTSTSAPISNQVAAGQLPDARMSNTGTINPNQSLLPSATEQSSLLATLQQRLEQSGDVGKALAAAHPTPAPAKVNNAQKNAVVPPNAQQGPVPVSSLATGVKAKGLHDLLAGAEDLIRQGKFDSAIQQYNQALRVAPNNPLPILGRAHAELAGGYYGRAEIDLRAVFRNDPELLLAQFDLSSLFPKDRLAFIRKDLHDLTQSDAKSERPWFLLAYLDYNTGDPATADKDLTEAEQRSTRSDWAVKLLRQHWTLPSNPTPAPLSPRPAASPAPAPPATPTAPAPASLNK